MDISAFFPVWNALTAAQQQLLQQYAFSKTVPAGTVLHNGSNDCAGLMLVAKGQLRAFMISEEGREISLYRLFDGDICLFSASCMMRSIQFEISIVAEKESTLWVIPPEIYKQVMDTSAPIANYTNEIMASRFSDVMWLMEQILWKSFDRRLAAFLLEESVIEDSNILKITHEAIGNHLGNPREVVTRMLRYFQGEGLVSLSRGTITIIDPKGLEILSD